MKTVANIVLNAFTNDSRVLKEAVSLHKNGYGVTVVALHENGLEEKEEIQGIPVHRVWLRSRDWPKNRPVQLLKYFEFIYKVVKAYKSYDILHCNDLNTLPVGVLVKKFLNKRVKVVYDAHEYEINDKPGQSRLSIKLHYLLEKSFIGYADKVITVSNGIAEAYARQYGIEKPALVLNTPYLQKKVERKDLFRKRFGITHDKVICLYQGGLSRGRGIEVLLEAFKAVDKRFVIVFMGYGPLEGLIREEAARHDNIFFHEAVRPDILLDYTGSADFGISTIENSCLSYYYCLPNKMFEYLMAEIPVIVSSLYEMKRIVEQENIGVVASENTPEALRRAIEKIVTLDRRLLLDNIIKLKTYYCWEEQEKTLLQTYKEIS